MRRLVRRKALYLPAIGLALAAVAIFLISRDSEFAMKASARRSFIVDTDYSRFRQIMVRKKATSAIVGHSGMKLLSESTDSIAVDTSRDDRPILNAILGRSRSDVNAKKRLAVQLKDPYLGADQLDLVQEASLESTQMHVVTVSSAPAGRLQAYQTELRAEPTEAQTSVTIDVELTVLVNVFPLFKSVAETRVQQAADAAADEQAAALRDFVQRYSGEAIILPEIQ